MQTVLNNSASVLLEEGSFWKSNSVSPLVLRLSQIARV